MGENTEVWNLEDMLKYQDGAIVSRTLVEKDQGMVTLFAFDMGQGLSEHTSPYDALAHILDGEVEISIEGEKFIVKAGEMLMMPANKPHALQSITRFKMSLIMIKA